MADILSMGELLIDFYALGHRAGRPDAVREESGRRTG